MCINRMPIYRIYVYKICIENIYIYIYIYICIRFFLSFKYHVFNALGWSVKGDKCVDRNKKNLLWLTVYIYQFLL